MDNKFTSRRSITKTNPGCEKRNILQVSKTNDNVPTPGSAKHKSNNIVTSLKGGKMKVEKGNSLEPARMGKFELQFLRFEGLILQSKDCNCGSEPYWSIHVERD